MSTPKWWGTWNNRTQTYEATERLGVEIAAWKAQFPSGGVIEVEPTDWDSRFWVKIEQFDRGFDDDQLYLIMTVRFAERSVRGKPQWENNTYELKIIYPEDFPSEAPEAFVLTKGISRITTPHIYPNGELCLFKPQDGRNFGWNPSENTGASIGLWAIQWIRAYRHFKKTDVWPGPEGH